jgi:hypothetical protein
MRNHLSDLLTTIAFGAPVVAIPAHGQQLKWWGYTIPQPVSDVCVITHSAKELQTKLQDLGWRKEMGFPDASWADAGSRSVAVVSLTRLITAKPASSSLAGKTSIFIDFAADQSQSSNLKAFTLFAVEIPEQKKKTCYAFFRDRSAAGGGGGSRPGISMIAPEDTWTK